VSIGWGWGQAGQRGLGRKDRGGSGISFAPWGEVGLGRGRVWENLGHREARGAPAKRLPLTPRKVCCCYCC